VPSQTTLPFPQPLGTKSGIEQPMPHIALYSVYSIEPHGFVQALCPAESVEAIKASALKGFGRKQKILTDF